MRKADCDVVPPLLPHDLRQPDRMIKRPVERLSLEGLWSMGSPREESIAADRWELEEAAIEQEVEPTERLGRAVRNDLPQLVIDG